MNENEALLAVAVAAVGLWRVDESMRAKLIALAKTLDALEDARRSTKAS